MARGHAAERSRTVENSEATSVLGRGARVRGRVHGEGDLQIEGHVEGLGAIKKYFHFCLFFSCTLRA